MWERPPIGNGGSGTTEPAPARPHGERAGGRVRPLREDDLPQVAELRQAAFRQSRSGSTAELADALGLVFLRNPWAAESTPSLVYENGAGACAGFLGVVPRPLLLGNRRLRAVVLSQLMAAREARGVAAAMLLREVYQGPQDLAFSDSVNLPGERALVAAGARTAPLYRFFWTLGLHDGPARTFPAAAGLATRVARRVVLSARTAMDAALWRSGRHPLQAPLDTRTEPLDAAGLAETLVTWAPPEVLRLAYDPASVSWILERFRQRWGEGRIHLARVLDASGGVRGWFVYALPAEGPALVLQVAAMPESGRVVLIHLLQHARERGARAVRGRAEPGLLGDLSGLGAAFDFDGPRFVAHARDLDLLRRVLAGEALLTGLDGEWWMNF